MKLYDILEPWQRKKFALGEFDIDDAVEILFSESECAISNMSVLEISLISIAHSLSILRVQSGQILEGMNQND